MELFNGNDTPYVETRVYWLTGELFRKRVLLMMSLRGTVIKKKLHWYIWVGMRIELTRSILRHDLRFAEKFDHPVSHVFIIDVSWESHCSFVAATISSSFNN